MQILNTVRLLAKKNTRKRNIPRKSKSNQTKPYQGNTTAQYTNHQIIDIRDADTAFPLTLGFFQSAGFSGLLAEQAGTLNFLLGALCEETLRSPF